MVKACDDAGAFMNQESHYVDLLDWLIGPVDKVQAFMRTTRDKEVEDTGVLNVCWRSGGTWLNGCHYADLSYKYGGFHYDYW